MYLVTLYYLKLSECVITINLSDSQYSILIACVVVELHVIHVHVYMYTCMKLGRNLTGTEYVEFHVQCKPLSDDESFMTIINSTRIPNVLIHVHVILNSSTEVNV